MEKMITQSDALKAARSTLIAGIFIGVAIAAGASRILDIIKEREFLDIIKERE